MIEQVPADLLATLKARHSEPQRHYHDWTHIEALLGHARSIESNLHDPLSVIYAILFHDAVYDPRAKDNERRSAELLLDTAPAISPECLTRARAMIEATEGHILPTDLSAQELEDCAHFLDMDLAILGAAPERFDIYEAQIRLEYAHVPANDFRKGRASVLRHFAEREALYFSDWGQKRFEAQARANLARSLAALST